METAGEGVFFPFSVGRILLGRVSLPGPSSSSCLFLDHHCLLVCCFVPLLFYVVFNRSGHLLSSFILTLIERRKLHLTPSNWSIHVLIFLDFASSCFDLGVSCRKALEKVFGGADLSLFRGNPSSVRLNLCSCGFDSRFRVYCTIVVAIGVLVIVFCCCSMSMM